MSETILPEFCPVCGGVTGPHAREKVLALKVVGHLKRVCPGHSDSVAEGKCSFCPDGHTPASKHPWSVWVAQHRDKDGQPTHLVIAPTDGCHVAEEDAEWLREVIRNAREKASKDER